MRVIAGKYLVFCILLLLLMAPTVEAAEVVVTVPDTALYATMSDVGAVLEQDFSLPAVSAPVHAEKPSIFRRSLSAPADLQTMRLALWAGISIGEGAIAYQNTINLWGKPEGKFHFKNDLIGDGMALSDEISHLFVAYKLTQITRLGFRWSGLSPSASARWGAAQAALYMAFVEYPLDAYNPDQGFGVSDLVADLAGAGLAWYRAGRENPRWDFKVSVKPDFFAGVSDRLLAQNAKQYDDYIYWLTYRISDNRYNPLVLGVGYSTNHPGDGRVDKELHLNIGTSLSEIGRIFGRHTESVLSPAEFYFLSAGPRVSWK